jgi:hypothetical protein
MNFIGIEEGALTVAPSLPERARLSWRVMIAHSPEPMKRPERGDGGPVDRSRVVAE